MKIKKKQLRKLLEETWEEDIVWKDVNNAPRLETSIESYYIDYWSGGWMLNVLRSGTAPTWHQTLEKAKRAAESSYKKQFINNQIQKLKSNN